MKGCCRSGIILLLIVVFLNLFWVSVGAADVNIYYNNDNVNRTLEPELVQGEIMVQAVPLAEMFEIEIKWIHSINTLEMYKEDLEIKMMQDNSILQVGDSVVYSEVGLIDRDGKKYIPLQPVMNALGFLADYELENNNFYINHPSTIVKGMHWADNKQEIIIEMDEVGPYRIDNTVEPEKIILEIENAILADDFIDDVSNKNFYVRFNRIDGGSNLQIAINGRYPIPFHRDGNIIEGDNHLSLTFLPTIENISWEDEQLFVSGNGDLGEPEIFYLDDPHRLVLDFENVMATDFEKEALQSSYIKDIETSQFSYDPLVMRVVVHLEEDRILNRVSAEPDGKDKLVFEAVEETKLYDLVLDSNKISFKTDRKVEPGIFTLNDPERLVIDLFNMERAANVPDEIEINNDLVQRIRTSDFQGDRVRMVADLKQITGYDYFITEEEDLYRYDIFLANKLEKIDIVEDLDYTGINILLSGMVEYEIEELTKSDSVKISLQDLKEDGSSVSLPEPGGLVTGVDIDYKDEFDGEKNIIFSLEENTEFEIYADNPDNEIRMVLSKPGVEAVSGEKIVVIDPGHGGFDPGAVGPSGLTEKEVALDISKSIAQKLQDKVDKIVLTRDSDEFISLRERVEMANQLDASVFVSIHANASNREYSEGTETFISPANKAVSRRLAEIIHDELIDEIQLNDRGIKEDNFYVVKHTDMPSILVEVAFLSNPHEEALLSSSVFRRKTAGAISRGILKYFEED